MKRYVKSDIETPVINKLKKCLQYEDDVIATYTVTGDYLRHYCIIENDSDDIASALEDTLHRLLNNGLKSDIYEILGAYIPDDNEMKELEKYDEYTELDLGYIIPGLIETFKKLD